MSASAGVVALRKAIDRDFDKLYHKWVAHDQTNGSPYAAANPHDDRVSEEEDNSHVWPGMPRPQVFVPGNCIGRVANGRECQFKASVGPYCKFHSWQATDEQMKLFKPQQPRLKFERAFEIEEDDDGAERRDIRQGLRRRGRKPRVLEEEESTTVKQEKKPKPALHHFSDESDVEEQILPVLVMKRRKTATQKLLDDYRPTLVEVFQDGPFKLSKVSRTVNLPFLRRCIPKGEAQQQVDKLRLGSSASASTPLSLGGRGGAVKRKGVTPQQHRVSTSTPYSRSRHDRERSPDPITSSTRRRPSSAALSGMDSQEDLDTKDDVKPQKKPRKPYTRRKPLLPKAQKHSISAYELGSPEIDQLGDNDDDEDFVPPTSYSSSKYFPQTQSLVKIAPKRPKMVSRSEDDEDDIVATIPLPNPTPSRTNLTMLPIAAKPVQQPAILPKPVQKINLDDDEEDAFSS